MDEDKLRLAIHSAIYAQNIRKIKTIREIYGDVTLVDITNMDLDYTLNKKKIFEWILDNPNYDFNSLFETGFTNEELFEYFKLYYESILFFIKKYKQGVKQIKPEDIK